MTLLLEKRGQRVWENATFGDKWARSQCFCQQIIWIDLDMNIRIGQAWSALNKMMKVWKSNLKNHFKVGFFRATVESVLLYSGECWTMTGRRRNGLDGTYTRMLTAVLGVSGRSIKPTRNCTATFLRLQIH